MSYENKVSLSTISSQGSQPILKPYTYVQAVGYPDKPLKHCLTSRNRALALLALLLRFALKPRDSVVLGRVLSFL